MTIASTTKNAVHPDVFGGTNTAAKTIVSKAAPVIAQPCQVTGVAP
jgi:hypothetical protein